MESIEEADHDEDSPSTVRFLVKNIFIFLITFINAFFNLMTTIFKSPTGIIWGVLALLAFHIAMSQATPISENDANTQTSLETMLNSLGPNPSFMLYSVKAMEASSFIIQLKEVQQEEFYGIDSACNAIPTQHEICLAHPASCQSTQMNIVNFEKTITKHSLPLYSLKRVGEYLHVQIVYAHIDPPSTLQYTRIHNMDRSDINKAEIDQQRNKSRLRTLDMNQIEAKNHLYTLDGKQNNPAVLDIEGIVNNTGKIISDDVFQKKQ